MPKLPQGNKESKRGEAKVHGQPQSVAGIEGEHDHAGEKGRNHGVVFRLPKDGDCTDHSRVRGLD